MKVLHIVRDKRPGNFSIEQIFQHVREELSNQVDFSVFQPNHFLDWKAIQRVRHSSLDVNHITGDVNYVMYGLGSSNSIVTVHDIGHYTNSLIGIKRWLYGELWFRNPLKRARAVTAISSFTADQLHLHFNIPYAKMEVIHDPLLPIFQAANTKEWPTGQKVAILQIGSGGNKNINRLIEAVKGLDCKLVLVRRPNPEMEELLTQYKIPIEWKYELDQEQLVATYRSADILFFASTYEGFGMPIIEAQAFSIPVITSALEPMKEVAGKSGALFVDPYSVQAIRNAILQIKESASLRSVLIAAGLENVKRFQLSSVADQYLQLYRHIHASG